MIGGSSGLVHRADSPGDGVSSPPKARSMMAFLKRRTAASSSSWEMGLGERTGRESRQEPAPAAPLLFVCLAFAGHEHSSCYAPHTKFRTPLPAESTRQPVPRLHDSVDSSLDSSRLFLRPAFRTSGTRTIRFVFVPFELLRTPRAVGRLRELLGIDRGQDAARIRRPSPRE